MILSQQLVSLQQGMPSMHVECTGLCGNDHKTTCRSSQKCSTIQASVGQHKHTDTIANDCIRQCLMPSIQDTCFSKEPLGLSQSCVQQQSRLPAWVCMWMLQHHISRRICGLAIHLSLRQNQRCSSDGDHQETASAMPDTSKALASSMLLLALIVYMDCRLRVKAQQMLNQHTL